MTQAMREVREEAEMYKYDKVGSLVWEIICQHVLHMLHHHHQQEQNGL